MFIVFRLKTVIKYIVAAVCIIFLFTVLFSSKPSVEADLQVNQPNPASTSPAPSDSPNSTEEPQKYIKWVDFKMPQAALEKAMNLDIKSNLENKAVKLNWIELLSYLACKYYGNMKSYKGKDMDQLVAALNNGETMENLTKGFKLYSYYYEAYSAVLGGIVGAYSVEVADKTAPNQKTWQKTYGVKAFSPFAAGYFYGHFDDFGTARSFGYKRKHLGHDMMGSVGTPIIAIESGTIEAMGWNPYGGWRLGIRSLDNKRSYYYAHLRKVHPYHLSIKKGSMVKAGDVIGYLGMTGYSTKEGSNNVKKPHLHVGMQLVFNEVQKEGINQIWVDLYDIINILQKHRSTVKMDPATKDFNRVYDFMDEDMLD